MKSFQWGEMEGERALYSLEISAKLLAVEASQTHFVSKDSLDSSRGLNIFEKMYSFTLQDRVHIIY